MEQKDKGDCEKEGQVYVWQGYTGKVELISFTTFLTRPVRSVALGKDHSLILTYDDSLFSCGSNEHGQLGVPSLRQEYLFDPVLVDTLTGKDIGSIACGMNHSGCVTKDGSLFCWGDNQHGQCGCDPAERKSINSPEEVTLIFPETQWKHGVTSPECVDHAKQVSFGSTHSVALSKEGKIWVWGSGPQIGLGHTTASSKPEILKSFLGRKVIKVVCGNFHTVALTEEDDIKKAYKETKLAQAQKSPHKKKATSISSAQSVNNELYLPSSTVSGSYVTDENHFQLTPDKLAKDKSEEENQSDTLKEGLDCKGLTVKMSDISVKVEKDTDNVFTFNETQNTDSVRGELDKVTDETETNTDDKNTDKVNIKDVDDLTRTDEAVETLQHEDVADKDVSADDDCANSPLRVEMRKKSSENQLTASVRSDSSLSGKVSRSISFLDETGAREYLARQFEDDDDVEPLTTSVRLNKQPKEQQEAESALSFSTGALMQSVTSFTSQMTSMTTKALSNIAAVPGKLRLSVSEAANEVTASNDTLDTSEVSELETESTEYLDLDNSALDFTNLTFSDNSANASQLSIPDSEKSFEGDASPQVSPKKQKSKKPGSQSSSTESLSLRTIEAKQENLRRRSLSFHTAEEDKNVSAKSSYTRTLNTVIWSWGKNSKGQLGTGDMLERSEPVCIQVLSDKRIIDVACGSQHSLALSSTGEVFSWGDNESGQLGHSELAESPAKIQLTQDCSIWDLDAGSEHSIFLMDNAGTQATKPEVFYTGKHPCKDLYVPIYKTARLSLLKFVRKAGWIRSVRTGGDNCACIAREDSEKTVLVLEVVRYFQQLYRHLHKIVQVFVKRIQISGFFTSLDIYPYKSMLGGLLNGFCNLTDKIGLVYVEITQLLTQGESILIASVFTHYDDLVTELKKYSTCFEDMVAIGGFEFSVKTDSTTFENLKSFYIELLPNSKAEEKPSHAEKFRQVMQTPLTAIRDMSQLVSKFADSFEKTEKENNLLSSIHLNLEHLIRTSSNGISHAENTRNFWESSSNKISDSLRSPHRRLIKDSKTSTLTLAHAGRFSTHHFYLFNDLFIHSQNSSYLSYPLGTVWIDTPTSENSSNQYLLSVTTPEEVLSLNAQSAQVKTEWVVAFNTAINKVLASQKSYNRQVSGVRVPTPVIRYSSHTFIKHTLFKDATYKGFWLNGKVHGSGFMKWPDGRRYTGKFKHGALTGSGKFVTPKADNTEEIMEGYWKDGKLHGHGKIRYSTGDLYDGYFKDGLRHGHGVYRKGRYLNSASFVYVGEWLYDKKHGYGVMDDILKGEKYMGMWQEDNRHGDGVVVTLDGMYFEGNFQYNKLLGSGLMLTDDNSCYEGEFNGITMLQGKGVLTFPSGDKIEGTFNGTWNQGLKLSGVFHKLATNTGSSVRNSPSKTSPENKSSLYGKLCVRPQRKWEEIFYQCFESLSHDINREPNTKKAWDQVASYIVAGKQSLRDISKHSLTSRQKLQLSNLDQLEKIPTHSVDKLTIEHYTDIVQYLTKAFETHAHPLGKLIDQIVDVFRAAYIGIGAHPRLLYHAVQEIKSYTNRIYRVIRLLFPELPAKGEPVQIYSASSKRLSTPLTENMGFLQRQISESDEDSPVEVVSATSVLQPILLPKIYPALFDLYALHSDREDEKCWERIQKLNKQGDMSLMAYLGIDQKFWCIEESIFKEQHKRLSSYKDHSYSEAVEILQQISTAFCPQDKLEVIEKAFLAITQSVHDFTKEEHLWCMDDLFPIFQFVVIRSRIHHLGAEIMFIEELMESHLEYGELGIMFTTLKACYHQIQNEKMPTH